VSGGPPSVPAAGCRGDVPPLAAGHLEPYGTRITIRPTSQELDPEQFIVALLEGLAARCVASGASVIGHLKCLLHMPGNALVCNLTSMRSGATCAGQTRVSEARSPLVPGESACLTLTVLVYGLPAARIDTLLREGLGRLLDPLGVTWSFASLCEPQSETR
jgi:hypothetical protein